MSNGSKYLVLFLFFSCSTITSIAQTAKKAPLAKKPAVSKLKMCNVPSDSSTSAKITLEDAQFWADSLPLTVICNDGKKYTLKQFVFTTILMNPLQTKEYGLANNGIPILAKKAINQMKPGDTIFLKDVIGNDPEGLETKLPGIVFVIKE